jgi:hypothetical protein
MTDHDIEIARDDLRELADCDALWKKLTPAIAEEATSEAAHFRHILTGPDQSHAVLEQDIWLRQLVTAAMTADLMLARVKAEQ